MFRLWDLELRRVDRPTGLQGTSGEQHGAKKAFSELKEVARI